MQQHLGRLAGVAKVDVNLADGKVVIQAAEDSQLDPAKIFKATYDSGVSIVDMTMEASGVLERDAKNGWVFRISGNQAYPVSENDVVTAAGATPPSDKVFVRAVIFRKRGKQKTTKLENIRLEIIEIRKQP